MLRHWSLALALAAPALAAAAAAPPWDKISDQDGIVVYQRQVEGTDTVSLRGEATIAASAQDVFDVLRDNAAAADWIPMVVEKHDIRPVSPEERIEYTHVGMPWPLRDRYFINSGKVEHLAGGVLRVSVKSVDEAAPAEDDKVLGKLLYSNILLTPEDGDRRTRVALEINTDPRGAIPKWLVNLVQRSWPRQFFEGLMAQLAKRGRLAPDAGSVAH